MTATSRPMRISEIYPTEHAEFDPRDLGSTGIDGLFMRVASSDVILNSVANGVVKKMMIQQDCHESNVYRLLMQHTKDIAFELLIKASDALKCSAQTLMRVDEIRYDSQCDESFTKQCLAKISF